MTKTVTVPQQYQPVHESVPWVTAYINRHNDRAYAARRLSCLSPPKQLALGERCLDDARRQLDYSLATPFLTLAGVAMGMVARTQPRGAREHLTVSAARLRLSELPLLSRLILNGELPDRGQAKAAYRREVQLATGVIHNTKLLRHQEATDGVYGGAKGTVGELATKLLANRYAVMHALSPDWYAFKSYRSDDQMSSDGCNVRNSWDVSVWTSCDYDRVLPTYRVQVKCSSLSVKTSDKSYADGVTVVKLHPDLSLPGDDSEQLSFQVLDDIQRDTMLHDRDAGARLNVRTEKLLTMLG